MMPEHALAMIQPWHPGMMYLLYCSTSEEEMLNLRGETQTFPAGRQEERLEPLEALVETCI